MQEIVNAMMACAMSIGLWCGLSGDTRAQIVPDGTLDAESSVLTPRQAGGTQIESGAIRGESLFHSFTAFNVNAGEQVFFASPVNVEAIVSRVTGSDISDISGTLGVDGSAGLYLLNPNGFIFGPAARLDIPGSFVASTATQLELGNGVDFSAIAPDTLPMLTVSVPLGLQPGQVLNGEIIYHSGLLRFLELGGDLSLAASKVELQGGQILQGNGDIHIQATEAVELRGSDSTGNFSAIVTGRQLGASGDVGDILIETGRLLLEDGASISSGTGLENNGGDLIIRAADSVELRGLDVIGEPSTIASAVFFESVGNAGDVLIETGRLLLEDGAFISTSTTGKGDGGNLAVRATESIKLQGQSSSGLGSAIFSAALPSSIGDAGDLLIETRHLVIEDGNSIFSSAFEDGNGGDLTIRAAESVELRGLDVLLGVGSSISSELWPLATGDAGDLLIDTERLLLEDTAVISSASQGFGNAGSLKVRANDWVLIDNNSSLEALTTGGGAAGELIVTTGQLTVQGNGQLLVGAEGNFPAGTLTLNANLIRLRDNARLRAETAAGDGGSITLDARGVLLRDNASISTDATGMATGGNISINISSFVLLLDRSRLEARAVEGQGGEIESTTRLFLQSEDSQLDASSDLGIDGTVSLNTLETRLRTEASVLSSNFANAEVDQRCASQQRLSEPSRFIQTGRGGLASDADALNRAGLWVDMRSGELDRERSYQDVSSQVVDQTSNHLMEAQGWSRSPTGQVMLTTETTAVVPYGALPSAVNCQHG